MAQRIQIPILILTGFLGSGKTSLLSQWLRAPEFDGAMAIINELGEVGLDNRLVQHSSDVPLLLENGCACCEAAEDLNATLERLFWQRLHRQIPKFNWVLIETTGIAEPAQLIASLKGHELINERYVVRGVVTTFDARRGPAHLSAHDECRGQIRVADAIILTKTDIASQDEQARALETVRKIRPGADILLSARGNLSADALLTAIDTLPAAQVQDAPRTHDHTHDHGHKHADEYTTAFAPLPARIEWSALGPALQGLLETHGDDLLRLKGTAFTGLNGSMEVIQAIAGEPFERTALALTQDAKPVLAGLTVIARHTPAQDIAADLLRRLGLPDIVLPVLNTEGAASHA